MTEQRAESTVARRSRGAGGVLLHQVIADVRAEVGRVIVGQERLIDRLPANVPDLSRPFRIGKL